MCSLAAVAVAVLRDALRPALPEDVEENYSALMCEAWDTDPSVRPTFLEILTRLDSMGESTSSQWYSGKSNNSNKSISLMHSTKSSASSRSTGA